MHDVVTLAAMPRALGDSQRLYCECVGGAVSLDECVEVMKKAGLTDIRTVDFTTDVKKVMSLDAASQALNLEDDRKASEIADFVSKGGIGYALLVGTKQQPAVD